MERPAMASLLSFLDKDQANNYVVVFDDLKRFARDTVFHLKLRREFDARGAKVECLNFTFEDTPEGQFVETILAAGNELERKQNARQVVQKMKARLEKGYWPFRATSGYRMVNDPIHGKILKVEPAESAILKEALEGFAIGRFENQVDVQRFLDSVKFRQRNSHSLDEVKSILTDPIRAGYIEYADWSVSRRIGHHEPIITSTLFEQVQNRLNGKIKLYSRADTSVEFPLRGFVLCAECLQPMTASWTKGRTAKHPYYHCFQKTCSLRGKSIQRKQIEGEFENILKSIKPKEKTLALTKAILLDVWERRMAGYESIKREHENTLDEVRGKIRMHLDRLSKTDSEALVKTYETEIEKLTLEEASLEQQTEVIRSRSPEFGTALDLTFAFLKNPYVYWKRDDIASKHLVLKLVFEERIAYKRGEGFGTAKLSLPLRVFELSDANDSSLVDRTGFEPATLSLQMRCSTN